MDEYLEFMRQFYRLTGINLELYKRPQMERRITALRDKHKYSDFRSFLSALARDETLMHEFLDRMTINVSEFFRNPERWDALTPFLHELSRERRILRAWSAACSTGEEPYTLAMLMEERVKTPYRILATDIDRKVISEAEKGVYRDHQIKCVPGEYLQRYFTQDSGMWVIREDVKRHVTFQIHNLLADAYPDSMDLIICRNVLIYFTDEAKRHVVSSFAKTLSPGGILFVGSTEQFMRSEEYGLINVGPFLYRRKDS
jgi:chemotaxis protein methyltransferase CheR